MGAVESQLQNNGLMGGCCYRKDPADKEKEGRLPHEIGGASPRGPFNGGQHRTMPSAVDRKQAWKASDAMGASFASKDAVHELRNKVRHKAKLESDLRKLTLDLEQYDKEIQRKTNALRKDPGSFQLENSKKEIEDTRKETLKEMGSISVQLRETITAIDAHSASTMQGGAGHAAPALFRKKNSDVNSNVGGIIARKHRSPSPQNARSSESLSSDSQKRSSSDSQKRSPSTNATNRK